MHELSCQHENEKPFVNSFRLSHPHLVEFTSINHAKYELQPLCCIVPNNLSEVSHVMGMDSLSSSYTATALPPLDTVLDDCSFLSGCNPEISGEQSCARA